ncbi:MAG: hypothetical protein AB1505_36090, partial [Candidatus Latescibacterota bacterium]
ESGQIASVADFDAAFAQAWQCYDLDEWAWVRHTYAARTGTSVSELGLADLKEMRAARDKAEGTAIKKVLADAEKEFDAIASTGFGQDGSREQRALDFAAVRGTFAGNSFVKQMQGRLQDREAE